MNERLKEMAEQAGFDDVTDYKYECRHDHLERFAELVRQEEREACAKLCDDWLVGRDDICKVAAAIRARGDK